jgi:hypothetical protein
LLIPETRDCPSSPIRVFSSSRTILSELRRKIKKSSSEKSRNELNKTLLGVRGVASFSLSISKLTLERNSMMMPDYHFVYDLSIFFLVWCCVFYVSLIFYFVQVLEWCLIVCSVCIICSILCRFWNCFLCFLVHFIPAWGQGMS